MKNVIIGLLIICSSTQLLAQSVGIGTTTPNTNAVLDLSSTTKGLLIPRMTSAQRGAIATPTIGLVVYQTDAAIFPLRSIPGFYIYDGTTWRRFAPSSEIAWAWNDNFIYTSSDTVGIGTSSPAQRLHVNNGNIYMQDNRTGLSPHLIFDSPNTPAKLGGIQWHRSGDTLAAIDYVNNTSVANYVKISAGAPAQLSDLTVNTNGYVGIGTNNPLGKLHIAASSIDNLVINDDDGIIQFYEPSSIIGQAPVKRAFVQLSEDDLRLGTNSGSSSGKVVIRTNGDDRVFVDGQGRVGINTQFPLAKLNIVGGQDAGYTSTANGYIMLGEAAGTSLLIDNNEILVRSNLTTPSTLNLQNGGGLTSIGGNTAIAGNTTMSGNASVSGTTTLHGTTTLNSTTTANAQFTVNGHATITGSNEVLGITGTNAAIQLYNGNQARGFIQQQGNNLVVGVNNGSLRLDGAQVAIGSLLTSAAGYKLSVTGKVICEEVKVKLSGNWPDYVFSPDYKRPTLNELESFIKTNRHLPNIPAAAEVEQNGMEVGDMQKKMMEKIEELTLYIIDLKKEIDELKKNNNK